MGKFSIFLREINLLLPRDADVKLLYFLENIQYQDLQTKRTQPDVSCNIVIL